MSEPTAELRAELSRRLKREQLNIFEFDGPRCDRIVTGVFARLRSVAVPAQAP